MVERIAVMPKRSVSQEFTPDGVLKSEQHSILVSTDKGGIAKIDTTSQKEELSEADYSKMVGELGRIGYGMVRTAEENAIYKKIKSMAGDSRGGAWLLIGGGAFLLWRVLR